ncbi:MAG: DUF3352 domain-containing protein [Cyanobacteriota bacterium]|jgi:hypothetical protein
MKGRPFLAVLLVVALLALGLGIGGWWLVWQRGPLRLERQPLTVPRAARFVPRQAPLSLYLFSDGDQPVDYARAVAPIRQRKEAARAVERLRDGAFAAAGLNYHDELAQWLAPEMGLALFDSPDASAGSGWLLALGSRDGEGARRFLQRFWQSRSLAGSGLQVSQYRGMGLISGRGALVGRDPVPLATALVQDDLVLLASGRATLERALDVSQIDELNQAGLTPLRQGVDQLENGMALLVARSGAFGPWLGWPSLEGEGTAGTLLVGALQPRGRELVFAGRLHLPAAPSPGPLHTGQTEIPPPSNQSGERPLEDPTPALLQGLGAESSSLALLRDPAALLQRPWLDPLLGPITHPVGGGPLPPLVAAADSGTLLVSSGPRGWLIGTSSRTPRPERLEAPLAAEGLIEAPLDVGGEPTTVWTRLEAPSGAPGRGAEPDQLRASVAGWRRETDGLAWWGQDLSLLHHAAPSRGAVARQRQLEALAGGQEPLRWALGPEATSALLQGWRPWTLLTSLAGGPLANNLQLAVAIDPEATPVHWRAHLQVASESHG